MRLEDALKVTQLALPGAFDAFARHLSPEWIDDALEATGTATIRKRRLPAEQVLWLVVGMALMRNESIERVAALLNLALPVKKGGATVVRSALTQARQRLSKEPVAYLFERSAEHWASQSVEKNRWRGLGLYAMDGTTLRVPDSPENWDTFGGQVGNGERAGSAYPMVRVVALMVVRSHLLASARFGAYSEGELTLAKELWPQIPNDSVTLVDRNFLVAAQLSAHREAGENRHWVTRAKKKSRLKKVQRLGPNDDLVEVQLGPRVRRAHPELPEHWMCRAIRYQRRGFPVSTILTSLLDAKKFPRDEVVELYHERWELEVGYDELKTHLLAREEAIRSRTQTGVQQEIWAILLAYNLVRLEMERAANAAGVTPTRISFVNALSMICHAWVVWSTPPLAPGRIPSALTDLRERLRMLLLPERRPERSFPRVVKIKMSNYNKKWVTRPVGN